MRSLFKKYHIELLLGTAALLFSFWLMWHTFSYRDGQMLIATKAWSDFASHIPLIRSFSFGDNFPPEYPLFPGEPIRYHFLFYFLVGLLEKIGLRIDFALNIPSALSFALLILSVYLLANLIFKSRVVAILSVVFFLFNGSLSFIEFFKTHPLSTNTITDIATNDSFPSFGPYDGKTVSAFWNLNIYTNQRHLALPFALLLLMVYWFFKDGHSGLRRKIFYGVLWGIFLGVLPLSHSSLFIMSLSSFAALFILLKSHRLTILTALVVGVLLSLPRVLFLKETASFIPLLQPGYLIADNLTVSSFLSYWFANLGLSFLLAPLGVLLAPRQTRKLFVAFLPLFIIGNIVQFSPEMAGNHKFFNVFLTVGNMFVAFVAVRLWKSNLLGRVLFLPLVLLLTLSGIIDFFPVKNDVPIAVGDYPKNPDVKWIMENTPKNAVFLNSSYLYHPASLAGRKIFLGWPYFAWSLGHNTNGRFQTSKEIYNPKDRQHLCQLLHGYKIDYVEVQPQPAEGLAVNSQLLETSLPVMYKDSRTGFTVYGNCNAG